MLIINPPALLAWLFRQKALYDLRKGKSEMTQREFNLLMESPRPDFSLHYGTILALLFNTAIFAAIIPVVLLLGALGLSAYLLLQKFFYSHRYGKPRTLSEYLNLDMLAVLELLPLTLAAGSFLFFMYRAGFRFREVPVINLVPSLLAVALGGLYAVLPWSWLNKKLLPIEKEDPAESYVEVFPRFVTDY